MKALLALFPAQAMLEERANAIDALLKSEPEVIRARLQLLLEVYKAGYTIVNCSN